MNACMITRVSRSVVKLTTCILRIYQYRRVHGIKVNHFVVDDHKNVQFICNNFVG